MTSPARFVSLALTGLLAACAASPTSPQFDTLRLTATASATDVSPGAAATVTFRLENPTSRDISVSFANSCQVMPYVAIRSSNVIVYPAGGGWTCAAVLTSLVVPANGVITSELKIAKDTAGIGQAGLPAGEYKVFARMEARAGTLESDPVILTVR